MNHIGIFGCSGFARETADIAFAMGLSPVFIAYDEEEKKHTDKDFSCILESELTHFSTYPLAIGIGDNTQRQKIAARYSDRHFINLIHPSASFGYQQQQVLEASKGLIICAGVRFTNHIKISDFCIVNLNATIGHDCKIDAFVNIAPGANISGNVHIESGCWIGTNVAINQGKDHKKMVIGTRTTIGSGSVVVKSCEAHSTYIGIPAVKKT